jgi:hypothetical protein
MVEALEQQRRSSTTFNVNPGAVGRDNVVEGTQTNSSWSVLRIESDSGNELSSEQEADEVLPTHTNPMLDLQHTLTRTAAEEARAVL